MKKIILIVLLFFTSIMSAQVSSAQIHFKDTVITKSIDNNQKDFWTVAIQILPFIISLAGVLVALYTVYYQKKLKSVEIKKELRTKQLDDFIDIYCKLIEKFEAFRGLSDILKNPNFDIKYKREKRENIFFVLEYLISKIEMTLTKNNEQQVKILLLIRYIKDGINDKFIIEHEKNVDELSDLIDNISAYINNNKLELKKICSDYVEKERTSIENLIPDIKGAKSFTWLKKSWKEVGEYKP